MTPNCQLEYLHFQYIGCTDLHNAHKFKLPQKIYYPISLMCGYGQHQTKYKIKFSYSNCPAYQNMLFPHTSHSYLAKNWAEFMQLLNEMCIQNFTLVSYRFPTCTKYSIILQSYSSYSIHVHCWPSQSLISVAASPSQYCKNSQKSYHHRPGT